MLTKKGSTIFFENPPTIRGFASVVGKKEANGPLREYFDVICMDSLMGQKSFEKAEAQLSYISLYSHYTTGKTTLLGKGTCKTERFWCSDRILAYHRASRKVFLSVKIKIGDSDLCAKVTVSNMLA
jgi:hypothetical protein